MNLLYKNSVFDYFELFRDKENLSRAAIFNDIPKNSRLDDGEDLTEHFKNLENKYVKMLDKYNYIGCKTGEITYRRDPLEIYEGSYMWRYFSQETVLTMSGKDCGEFKVTFDTSLNTTSFPRQAIIKIDNIVYSDNTPEEFKTMFEDIFA